MTDPILARAFAVADATEQAALFDSFGRELFAQCGGRNRKDSAYAGYDHQVCNISGKLTKDGVQLIKDLHSFIELRTKDMS